MPHNKVRLLFSRFSTLLSGRKMLEKKKRSPDDGQLMKRFRLVAMEISTTIKVNQKFCDSWQRFSADD
jgi:hypothetical protein